MRGNLKNEVAKSIRDEILSGELRPGLKIDQEAVANALGVSRLPVREALIILETEGLVDNLPRRGSFVAAISPNDIRDHFAMFGLVSGLAAERAALHLGDAELRELHTNIDRMEASQDPREQDDLNFQFHRMIHRTGVSRRLRSVLRLLANNMPTHFFEFNDDSTKERSVKQHRQIHDALISGDGSRAAEAVADHFRAIGDQAVATLEARGFWKEIESPD